MHTTPPTRGMDPHCSTIGGAHTPTGRRANERQPVAHDTDNPAPRREDAGRTRMQLMLLEIQTIDTSDQGEILVASEQFPPGEADDEVHKQPAAEERPSAVAVTTLSPSARLWRNRDFNIYWIGRTLGVLGYSFTFIAMPLLVLSAAHSVAVMGLVTATMGVSQLLTGPISGLIVDRVDRRKLMIVCDLIQGAVLATVPLVWWLWGPQIWLIFVVVFIGATVGNCFQVATITAVANLVEKDQLPDANSRLSGSFSAAFMIGPVLAGIVCARFGPMNALLVDVVTCGMSAFALSLVRLRRASAERPTVDASVKRHPLADMLEGARFLWNEPVLRTIGIMFAVFNFLGTAGDDLIIFHLKHDLGQPDAAVGVVLGVFGVGSILGSAIAPRVRRRFGFGATLLSSLFLTGLTMAALGLAPTVIEMAIVCMVMAFFDVFTGICSISIRQEITPDHLLGRVTAAFWVLCDAPGPIGAAAATALAAHIGTVPVLVMMGLVGSGLAIFGLFTPARARHPEHRSALHATPEPEALIPAPAE